MLLRTQLLASTALALALATAAVAITFVAAGVEREAVSAQTRAQGVSHHVSGLLVLTQEYARHMEPRAAEQWRQRHGLIESLLAQPDRALAAPLKELAGATHSLPELFGQFEGMADRTDEFSVRRRELVVDQLLANTQSMSDHALQWYQEVSVLREEAARRFKIIAITVPVAMLALFVAGALMLTRRVLRPLAILDAATTAVASGDLTARIGDGRRDEFGQLKRQFDVMTQALSGARDKVNRSQKQLRAVADSLPALVAYVDANEVYQFTNEYYRTVYGVEPDSLIGRQIRDHLGEGAYARVGPNIKAALRGEHRRYEIQRTEGGATLHFLVEHVPDVDEGAVAGVYVMVLDITARKEAELAQARSEERVRSILTHAPDAFVSIDPAGRITEWNRQAELSFGWMRAEVMGRDLAEVLIPPVHRLGHIQGMARFAQSGEGPVVNQRIEITALHREGHEVPVELSVSAVPHDGSFAANAFLRDITDRRRAEEQLRNSEHLLRDLTNHIPAMVGYFDREERCLFANKTVLDIHGIAATDTKLHTLKSGLGDESYALHEPHVPRVLGGESRKFEGHIRHLGRDAYFQAHMIPHKNLDGSVAGFYVMSFDVTAVRRAELARAKSEQTLRQITDNLPVLIAYMDRREDLQFANATYRDWFGKDPGTVLGQPVKNALGQQLYADTEHFIRRALAGERVEFELDNDTPSGPRSTHSVYIPDVNESGGVLGLFALVSDVTTLKKAERNMRALARSDALTGLPNRLHFNEKLREALDRQERRKDSLALFFLDIDHFKAINDSFGHGGGDEVLIEFSKRLVDNVRKTDTVARLAGDEFVVILEDLHQSSEAAAVAQKIVDAIHEPFDVGALTWRVTTSVGVAFLAPQKVSISASDLLNKADEALYAAKSSGRNNFRLLEART